MESPKILEPGVGVVRPLFIAACISPFWVLITGALQNQQADNLLPAFFSTDHLTWFYWSQTRFGNIDPVLAFPIQDIRLNLIFQVFLRVFSIVFVIVWAAQAVAVTVRCQVLWVYLATGLFSVIWISKFTDGGDALLNGANAHPLALPFVVLAIGIVLPSRFNIGRHNMLSSTGLLLVPLLFWMIALWTSVFVALWAPAFILILLGADSNKDQLSFRKVAAWVLWQLSCIVSSTVLWSLIAIRGGENGTFRFSEIKIAITTHQYIWNNLLLAMVFCLLALIIVRSWKAMGLVVAAGGLLASIVPIAASDHVRAYEYMPRYFGVPLLFGSLIPFLMLSSWLFRRLKLVDIPLKGVRAERYLSITLVALGLIGVLLLVPQQIGYGTGEPDAIGFINTGKAMSISEFDAMKADTGIEFSFIAGNYWSVWPTVFELRTQGVEILGLTKKAIFQNHFGQLYSGGIVNGLCIDEIGKCYGAAINAQLNGILLLTKVDEYPIATLSNGTPVRLMTVQAP
jgi:hypothetical protein